MAAIGFRDIIRYTRSSVFTIYDFWKSRRIQRIYTGVYCIYGAGEECRDRYFLYNPDGEVIAESSDRKIYLIAYDGRALLHNHEAGVG